MFLFYRVKYTFYGLIEADHLVTKDLTSEQASLQTSPLYPLLCPILVMYVDTLFREPWPFLKI